MNAFDRVEEFFKKHTMHPDQIDLQEHIESYTRHLQAGLTHEPKSLAMLPTYINLSRHVPRNEKVLAMDAGGTNFRAALVYFDHEGKPIIEKFRKGKMPGVDRALSEDEFFDEFALQILDLCQDADKIGFCFSYPAQAMPDHDGKLLFFTKGVQVNNSEGMLIAAGLKKALKRRGISQEHEIVILNDTVTTLLTGMIASPEKEFDGCIGVILGTGMNTAYAELNENIIKISGQLTGARHIVNVESGNFDAHVRGDIDEKFIQETLPHGQQAFEKAISGAYLGPLTYQVILAMAKEGVFDAATTTQLAKMNETLTTTDLANFLHNPHQLESIWNGILQNVAPRDVDALYRASELVVQRAAKLFAINIAAILLQSGHGMSPRKPARIVIDGTTFYATKGLKEGTLCQLSQALNGAKHRYYEVIEVENASLLGAAVAALTAFEF